jgi:ATP-binding cassette subfamily B protein
MTGRMSDEPRAGIDDCFWPLAAREALAARVAGAAALGRDVGEARFELSYADVTPRLGARARAAAPAVLRVGEGAGVLLGLLGYDGGDVRLVRPDGRVVRCEAAALARCLRAPAEAASRPDLEAAVVRAGIASERTAAVADALCVSALGATRVAEGARLRRVRPSLRAALREAGVGWRVALALAGYLGQLALFATLWWLIGARAVGAASSSAPGAPVFGAFGALAAGVVVARLIGSWAAGRVAIDGGEVLRERMMHGILALDSESIRTAGIGQLLGRVVETEALESLALGGGLTAAAGLFELLTGVLALAGGVAAPAQLGLLGVWSVAVVALAAAVHRTLGRWSARRLALTHDLVERMAGQRTLVLQQPPALRHREEDAALDAYARDGRALDRAGAALAIVVPRGWLLTAVALLAPALSAVAARPGGFAISLGGVLFVYTGLRKLAQAFPALSAARISWRHVSGMLAGPTSSESAGAGEAAAERPDAPLIAARGLSFTYPGRRAPVLSDLSLDIARGARVLLEGPSGGGKSTLGSILAGLRVPDRGELSLEGRPRASLGGARWRARIGAAPQFHENHVFSASLMFNLLMGRAWPPRREDVMEAEAVLRELDLGGLLARMPSGMEQLVGDSGWQLSHGERSRLFIARSLLQPLDARVLDESFAALDPETLERALACVLRRAETLIVIAHT